MRKREFDALFGPTDYDLNAAVWTQCARKMEDEFVRIVEGQAAWDAKMHAVLQGASDDTVKEIADRLVVSAGLTCMERASASLVENLRRIRDSAGRSPISEFSMVTFGDVAKAALARAPNILVEYGAHLHFWRYGSQTFRLAHDLAVGLLATEFRCPREAFRLPFQSFLLALPLDFTDAPRVSNDDGTSLPLGWIYVLRTVDRQGDEDGLVVHAVSRRGPDGRSNWKWFTVDISRLDSGADERALIKNVETIRDAVEEVAALRLALNTVLYVNSMGADVRCAASGHDRKAPMLSPALSETSPRSPSARHTYEVGHSVHLPRLEAGANPSSGDRSGWRYRHRFWVRGHWRLARVGPGRADQRLTWVRPHLKGPELAQLLKRPYDVESRLEGAVQA